VVVVAVWIGAGPLFGYSDTWQLVINTITNVATFVMVFLIQRAHQPVAAELRHHEIGHDDVRRFWPELRDIEKEKHNSAVPVSNGDERVVNDDRLFSRAGDG
jgi:low affinity Fe/Cu permease